MADNGSSPVVPSVGAVPVEVTEDAVDAAAMAIGCYSPEQYERWRHTSKGQQAHDRALAGLRAAYPLIAARVQAELEAEDECPRTTCQQIAATASDVYCEAEERQRIDGLIAARLAAPVGMKEYGNDALVALRAEIAAGSAVPVATPDPTRFKDTLPASLDEAAGVVYVRVSDAPVARTNERFPNRLMIDYDNTGYPVGIEVHVIADAVATPTEPVDEVKCPGCGATLRAQMSDRSTPERGAALEDLEHALTLALQAMAENDCCADEDDPDWRGPAIEQFRQDLRALGVRDAEMDAVGIKAPAEQDGQLATTPEPIDLLTALQRSIDRARGVEQDGTGPVKSSAALNCDTCDDTGAVCMEYDGSPGSGGWFSCPDCIPTPSVPVDEPVEQDGQR